MMARMRRTDDQTAERLLSGDLAPEDVPPGLSGVAALFASAAVPADPADPDEALLTAMSVAALSAEPANRRIQMLSKSRSAKIGALAVGGLVLLGGTAAAGELPDPLQDAAADVADVVGVDLPESSNGLAETVHQIKETTPPGERGAKISQAAHDRNEARKAARAEAKGTDADETDDESEEKGKAAEARKANEERKAAREADDTGDEVEETGEPAEQANPNATDGGKQNAEDGAGNATVPDLPPQAEAGQANRPTE